MQLSPGSWPCGECQCDENDIGLQQWKIPGVLESTRKCLRKMVTEHSWYLLELHRHYLQGNLAVAGGVTDQPGAYLDAMNIITEWQAHGSSGDS